jgi:MSHA biogenesis protein MshQ
MAIGFKIMPFVASTDRGAMATGTWLHVAATLSATQGVIYINGDKFHVSPVTPVKVSRGKVQIGMGHYRHPSDDEFTGFMDDIMIFNRALSADEVNTLYRSR